MKIWSLFLALILSAMVSAANPAFAETARPDRAVVNIGALKITGMWLRQTPPGAKAGSGYFSVTNAGNTADRLIAVASDVAEITELHEMKMTQDVMTMRPLDKGIVIEAGASIALKPGEFHMMLMGLHQPLKQGEIHKISLIFEKAGEVQIDFPVQKKLVMH